MARHLVKRILTVWMDVLRGPWIVSVMRRPTWTKSVYRPVKRTPIARWFKPVN